ncbi:major facilitator superfamily domain-containing protein [Podospora appendiculata]|uniref:Major facilitator superfamily domain-containing protein n=1 Tax=Podospora appendiculata TaxID=314037 RepID=A0AAE0XJS9_9PEZI|nr:major facilitator superfamily domain-containing protein [Podospora appendiculata]
MRPPISEGRAPAPAPVDLRSKKASSDDAIETTISDSDDNLDEATRDRDATGAPNQETPDADGLAAAGAALERRVRRKVDFRLCTIAGILCSLNLLDSGVLSSAAVTSMLADLGLDEGNRFSVSIFVFTIASIVFQLPSTIAVRTIGPRRWFTFITIVFGLITLCTGFVQTWRQMIALRILLGAAMSGIYPGLTYLISTWYPRREQQLRFAYMQSGEVVILATGSLVNYGLNRQDGRGRLAGWRWMFIVQGLCTCVIGFATYWWMVDFPENSQNSFRFLTPEEAQVASQRIQRDRGDLLPQKFALHKVLVHAKDAKVWAFAALFFLQNIVSTALAYFVPIILQNGLGYSPDAAIVLSAPPYYYAVVPVIVSSWLADRLRVRAPVIAFNAICMIVGFTLLGFANNAGARYVGVFLSTGAYVANWTALSAYQANNINGQWKRVFTAAACTMLNGTGGIAGSYIVRNAEAPQYPTAVWVSIGSNILLLMTIALLSLHFYLANNSKKAASTYLENTEGFKFTY